MSEFEFFTSYIMAPVVFFIGIAGNMCGILVISQKDMIKIGPRDMYNYLLISDSLFLFYLVNKYISFGFGLNFTILSKYVCKLYNYFNYSLAPVSPWILSI
jgi:hypothetical protein